MADKHLEGGVGERGGEGNLPMRIKEEETGNRSRTNWQSQGGPERVGT